MDNQIRALVDSGKLTFKGARKPTKLGEGAYPVLIRASVNTAKRTGRPINGCFAEACAAYWRLYDERH